MPRRACRNGDLSGAKSGGAGNPIRHLDEAILSARAAIAVQSPGIFDTDLAAVSGAYQFVTLDSTSLSFDFLPLRSWMTRTAKTARDRTFPTFSRFGLRSALRHGCTDPLVRGAPKPGGSVSPLRSCGPRGTAMVSPTHAALRPRDVNGIPRSQVCAIDRSGALHAALTMGNHADLRDAVGNRPSSANQA